MDSVLFHSLINNRPYHVPGKFVAILGNPLFSRKLFSDTQLLDNGTIAFNINFNQVIEQTTTFTN